MNRHLAIGDIHGCFTALETLVAFVGIRSDDVLVALGDYVDRGPRTKDVLEWLIAFDLAQTLVPLRGNHEIMMLNARMNPSDKLRWGQFGAIETLESYEGTNNDVADLADIPESHWQFLSDRLLSYFETDTHIFVHASVDPCVPLDQQSDQSLYWGRYSDKFPGHMSGKMIVCGHTSQHSGLPAMNGHAICIDTGACKNGWLSCLDVQSGTVWQANEAGVTRQLELGDLASRRDI